MKKKVFYIIVIILLSITGFWACDSDDDFSSDASLKLSFSSDTISFDTVFTTLGSATRTFKIHNRNKNSLSISSIKLMDAANSGFRINVDGEKGTFFADVDILKKDSLFAFVEVTIDPLKTDNPVLVRDSIQFITNGNIQYVQLAAIGQDVHMWQTKVVELDTVLTGEKPFLIYESIVVAEGATLHVGDNCRFFFRNGATLKVYGTLKAKGSIEKPIVLRGDRMDRLTNNVPYDNVSGQWDGVYFGANSFDNELENVFVRNSVNGLVFYESTPAQKKATLNNTIVQNTSSSGVYAINCDIDAQNCLFANARNSTLTLIGGKYSFRHCTIANYYRWAIRNQPALIVANNDGAKKTYPLTQCDFTNSVIYGSATNELNLVKEGGIPFSYSFTNCLMRLKDPISDPNFTNVIWNENPQFRNINQQNDYSYNFDLLSTSPAINKGISSSVLFDLKGRSRDSKPDIGCYEWTVD